MTAVTEATARRRVARGVALLDGIDPDWRQQLNPDRLDMASGAYQPGFVCGCVAAQWHYVQAGQPEAAGRYAIGCELLADRVFTDDAELAAWAVDHGLLAEAAAAELLGRGVVHTASTDEEYDLLTRLWREAITGAPWAAEEVGV